ncbi:MAG TPA: hypothetical protein ENH10_07615 [Bacteroidetes bacterium]|nr:serine/threonine-protein kinase PknD [bacterium BMS3Bbin04]HDO65881.1 hypothetical protein [Bacteroidota bacterium]HEX05006.1 hypothetical protein [Bacteroidota bacterium]
MNISRDFAKLLLLAAFSISLLSGCATTRPKDTSVFWPQPPEKKRIEYLKSISAKTDIDDSRLNRLRESLTGEQDIEKIIKPYGVAVDARGRIYVTDAGNKSVLVFNENPAAGEDYLDYVGAGGSGTLVEPAGIAISKAGVIFVSDVVQGTVYAYNQDFEFLYAVGSKDSFIRPAGLAFNEVSQELVVIDAKSHNLKFFSAEGDSLRTVGEKGINESQFNVPSNVVCDKEGKIYVVDSMNFRVQIFNSAGEFVSTFGQADNIPGSFSRPKGITLDSDGHVYVADAAFDNIQIFQPDGTLMLFFGSAGSKPGQFQLPAGMCFDSNDKLYVVDQYNRRIQIFQYVSQ